MLTIRPNHSRKDLSGSVNSILHRLGGVLFPEKCMKCGCYIDGRSREKRDAAAERFRPYFCPSCLKAGYDSFEPPFCFVCGMKFYGTHLRNHRCGKCAHSSPDVSRVRAAGMYDGLMKEALHLFKYSGRIALSRPMGGLMLDAYRRYFTDLHQPLLIPVPLHPSKLKHRGFNQSFLLAREFHRCAVSQQGRTAGFSIDCRSLVRIRKTPSQTDFAGEQRKRNVKDAFDVTKPARFRGRCIVLVDDVYTTGATCSEAACTLLKAGAGTVDVLVAARAF